MAPPQSHDEFSEKSLSVIFSPPLLKMPPPYPLRSSARRAKLFVTVQFSTLSVPSL